jgi:hypothetical protein
MFKVTPVFTLAEEDGHALCHVDSQKSIKISDHGSQSGYGHRLRNAMLAKVFSTERGYLHVELDHKCTI